MGLCSKCRSLAQPAPDRVIYLPDGEKCDRCGKKENKRKLQVSITTALHMLENKIASDLTNLIVINAKKGEKITGAVVDEVRPNVIRIIYTTRKGKTKW